MSRYPTLSALIGLLRALGIIILIIGLCVIIGWIYYTSHFPVGTFWTIVGVAFTFLAFVIAAVQVFVMAEVCQVIVDIEANTHSSDNLLYDRLPVTRPARDSQ